jgi:hypothetical protein
VYLSQVVSTFSDGVCEILIDGAMYYSAAQVLRFLIRDRFAGCG